MHGNSLKSPKKVNVLVEEQQLQAVRDFLITEGKGRTFSQFVRDACHDYIVDQWGRSRHGLQDDIR